jgi:hypothetical protein
MYVSKQCAVPRFQRLASLALLWLSLSSAAHASIIQYQVDGIFDSGSLTGLHYSQTFSFDDISRPPVLGALPWETDLLSFSMDVEGMSKHWTIADWPLAHTFSQWVNGGGFLNSVAYLATPGPSGEPPAFVRFYDDGEPHSRTYHVKWYDWSVWNSIKTDSIDTDPIVRISAVPEPSSMAMWLVGLIGMIVLRRHRENQA